jgi:flavin-dependent dehydrogenase
MKYDVAIIGGGPAGYTAAEKAATSYFMFSDLIKFYIGINLL